MAQVYERQGEKQKARVYDQKAKAIKAKANKPLTLTVYDYNEIYNLVSSRHARFIAMQYPLRDVSYLKGVFSPELPIVFVENKENFQQALKNSLYGEYFNDSFGGDFGHCTRKGNRLMAINASEAILEMIKASCSDAKKQ